jgi:guanine nucleotide-exchange factor
MTYSRKQGDEQTTTVALDVMLGRLSLLSVDSRPEIRNCATNTLFSATMSNANMFTPIQWRSVFEDIIFPLFDATEQKSLLAMSSNEEAITPEIKKGVRMAVHHSRDTAHKQVYFIILIN